MASYVNNIFNVYTQSCAEAYQEGVNWYPRIKRHIGNVSSDTGTDLNKAVSIFCIIAARSSSEKATLTSVKKTLLKGTADNLGPGSPGASTKPNNLRINKIIHGESPSLVLTDHEIVYMNNILYPFSNVEARTTWLPMEVALNRVISKSEFDKMKGSPEMIDAKNSYLECAKLLDVPVPLLEAVTWNQRRITHYPKTVRVLHF